MKSLKKISIIVPCFNEEESLALFDRTLTMHLPDGYLYELIYVDDGSTDQTFEVILALSKMNPRVKYISFSRNFGHQNALKAGYDFATGDCAISLDADLQHPPAVIPELIRIWENGYDIVNTIRQYNKSIPWSKKSFSRLFYFIINKLSDVRLKNGMADFRLIDKKVLINLKQFPENYLFFRGIFSWVGFKQAVVPFIADDRVAGKTKYTFRRMLKFATTGVTSFSIKPLRISVYLGFTIAMLAFFYGLYAVYMHIFADKTVTGWTSVIISILFVGGINLLMLGIIGEYLGKLFIENKRRPNYLISDTNFSFEEKNG